MKNDQINYYIFSFTWKAKNDCKGTYKDCKSDLHFIYLKKLDILSIS